MEHFWSFSVWPNAPEGYSSTRGAPLMHAQSLSSYSFNCMMAQALSNSLLDLTPLLNLVFMVKIVKYLFFMIQYEWKIIFSFIPGLFCFCP